MRQLPRLAWTVATLLGVAALSGCQQSAPDAAYFAAHEAEAKAIIADCAAGKVRGSQCDAAKQGLQKANGARAFAPTTYPTTGSKGY